MIIPKVREGTIMEHKKMPVTNVQHHQTQALSSIVPNGVCNQIVFTLPPGFYCSTFLCALVIF